MRRWLLGFTVAGTLLLALSSVASAAVHIRVAVSPDSIARCSEGHFFIAIANDGPRPIRARVCFALVHDGSPVFGPVCGIVPLAAGERRARELTFLVPPRMPLGDYEFHARAQAPDSSSDNASARFTIIPATGPCVPPPPTSLTPEAGLMNTLMQGTGVQLDRPLTIRNPTWGRIKQIYR